MRAAPVFSARVGKSFAAESPANRQAIGKCSRWALDSGDKSDYSFHVHLRTRRARLFEGGPEKKARSDCGRAHLYLKDAGEA